MIENYEHVNPLYDNGTVWCGTTLRGYKALYLYIVEVSNIRYCCKQIFC